MDKTKHTDEAGTRDTPRRSGSKPAENPSRSVVPDPRNPHEPDRDPEEEGSAGKRQV